MKNTQKEINYIYHPKDKYSLHVAVENKSYYKYFLNCIIKASEH